MPTSILDLQIKNPFSGLLNIILGSEGQNFMKFGHHFTHKLNYKFLIKKSFGEECGQ